MKFLRSIFDTTSPVWSTFASLVVCVVLACSGIVIGVEEDSFAVRTNGIIAAIDIVTALVVIAAVRAGIRSPDFVFNYGYGKYESLGRLVSALFLFQTLAFTLFSAFYSLASSQPIADYPFLIAFSMISFLVMNAVSRLQFSQAKKFRLNILQFDAEVWRADSFIELWVIVSLGLGWFFSWLEIVAVAKFLDVAGAVGLVGFALRIPLKHSRNAVDQLLDRTLPDSIQFDIIAVVAENINSFCEFRSVHTRQSGRDLFVELDVVMPFDYTFEQAFPLEKTITESIKKKYPTAVARIYATPCPRDCIRDGKCFCPVKSAKENISNLEIPAGENL